MFILFKTQCETQRQYEIEILIFSRRGPRSPDNAEFGHLVTFVWWRSRCRRRRGFENSLVSAAFIMQQTQMLVGFQNN